MTKGPDKWLLFIVSLLIIAGLLSVYSSTSVISPDVIEKSQGKGKSVSSFGFLKKQLFTAIIGAIAMFIAYRLRPRHVELLTFPLLIVSLVCLILAFTPLGVSAGGARRWIRAWPSVFQPSELVKLSMVVFMAWYMSSRYFDKDRIKTFLAPIMVMAVFQVMFIKQPDFGAVMSLGILTMTMLFIGGLRLRYIALLGIVALPFVIILAMEPYRFKRITAFLDPWKDPLGSGFQLVQSFIALGSGGLQGVGLGEGRQKLSYLPEIHTDFIFSLIGEELGFIGASVVVLLFLMLFIRGLVIAHRTQYEFYCYLAYGITFMFTFQALINFAVVTGMAPTKGLPLPFISYGGSSLLVNMIAAGLLLNISRYNAIQATQRPAHERRAIPINRPLPLRVCKGGILMHNGLKRVYSFDRMNNRLF